MKPMMNRTGGSGGDIPQIKTEYYHIVSNEERVTFNIDITNKIIVGFIYHADAFYELPYGTVTIDDVSIPFSHTRDRGINGNLFYSRNVNTNPIAISGTSFKTDFRAGHTFGEKVQHVLDILYIEN